MKKGGLVLRRALLFLLIITPILFAQCGDCLKWSDVPKLFATIAFVNTFISVVISYNSVVLALVLGAFAAVIYYVIALIAIRLLGH